MANLEHCGQNIESSVLIISHI